MTKIRASLVGLVCGAVLLGALVSGAGRAASAQTPQLGQAQAAAPQTRSVAAVSAETDPALPGSRLLRFSNTMPGDLSGVARTPVTLRFALYASQQGGEALWSEVQQIEIDRDGSYVALLGAGTSGGLPASIFSNGNARWLSVSLGESDHSEEPRLLLVGVPYAFEATNAETLGGLPASAFVRASGSNAAAQVNPDGSPAPVTGAGTTNYVPVWTGAATLANSVINVSGINVGIDATSPVYPLDVNGVAVARAGFKAEPNLGATAATGVNSPPVEFQASAYSSASAEAVPQYFAWEAQAVGNNTPSPSANLALLFSSPTGTLTPTELSIGPTGLLNFATGQKFPGTGPGTITGVTASSPLTSTTTAGAVALSLSTTQLESTLNEVYPQLAKANTFKEPITFAAGQTFPGAVTGVTAGSGLKGGGTGGALSLSVDPSKVPLLAAANTFTGNQTITGKVTINGEMEATSVDANVLYAGNGIQSFGNITAMGQIDGMDLIGASPSGTPTASAGDFSYIGVGATAYNSQTKSPVENEFFWGAFPVNNNTPNPSAVLQLQYQTATANTFTGFKISDTGIVTFANGQTFPGGQISGNETVTGALSAASGTFSGPVFGASTGSEAALVGNGKASGEGLYASSDTGIAAYGVSYSPSEGSAGVFGLGGTGSKIQAAVAANQVAGVWGDTGNPGSGYAAGVIGTADNADGGSFFNNSKLFATVYASNSNSGGTTGLFKTLMASTPTGTCGIGGNGDLSCTGQVKALVSTAGGARKVETYSVQSPENWMEDFGSGELTHGVAVVAIDPAFAETVSETPGYHVFLTPNGDSKGLYVVRKTTTSFEVHESGGGTSSLGFDYRIVARRRGYEQQRLVDVTDGFNQAQAAARPENGAGASHETTPGEPATPQ